MSSPLVILVEADEARRAALAGAFADARLPVVPVPHLDAARSALASDRGALLAVSGLGGGVRPVLESFREDPATAGAPILALIPDGDGLDALSAGADDVLRWPAPEPVLRARLRSVGATAQAFEDGHRAVLAVGRLVDAVEAREPHRIEHSVRISHLAAALAVSCGLSAAEVERVRLGALVHDVGTVAIPDSILFKKTPLTSEEFALVKTHPVVGFEMLRGVRPFEPLLPFVLRHHERIDGSGYPDGLRGRELPLPVQVVSLVDAYDAMTSARPYRSVRSHGSTLQILVDESARGLWDPALVDLLPAAVEETEQTG